MSMSLVRDQFYQQLDNNVVGIRSTITKLSQLLKEHDEELWLHLEITTKKQSLAGFTAEVQDTILASDVVKLTCNRKIVFLG
ncbi:hypothetical protein K2173_009724 [Erythroxylum novogranatense]|uniref:Uncharacterized protein n=1 Tax=Erythroxylum novogranatense TaxID=1862640 RepID=A0AAV8U7H5_9ROSI|nr:hypothetical protein K2173_009724 [Erythroxylum novogranatense]